MRYRLLKDGETGDVVRVVFEGGSGRVEWFGMGRIMFGSTHAISLESVLPHDLQVGHGQWTLSEIREQPGIAAGDEDLADSLLEMLER